MKLIFHDSKIIDFRKRRQRRTYKNQLREATQAKIHKKYCKHHSIAAIEQDITKILKSKRNDFIEEFYRPIKYIDHNKVIRFQDGYGLETNIQTYIDSAEQFIGSNPKSIFFDIQDCTRMWPSGIMILCSFLRWVELTSIPSHAPNIGSSDSKSDIVNSYLTHCGFYDYVKRSKPKITNYYSDTEIVKIRRESKMSDIETREDEIVSLLRKYSIYNDEQIEEFENNVLIEVFNNITEHGRNIRGAGWWTISQYHKKQV